MSIIPLSSSLLLSGLHSPLHLWCEGTCTVNEWAKYGANSIFSSQSFIIYFWGAWEDCVMFPHYRLMAIHFVCLPSKYDIYDLSSQAYQQLSKVIQKGWLIPLHLTYSGCLSYWLLYRLADLTILFWRTEQTPLWYNLKPLHVHMLPHTKCNGQKSGKSWTMQAHHQNIRSVCSCF